ncbi:MAG: MlaD family protein, partial [Actinomycetota bacterium]|nr:MlaD family protein [Actinomycetota bacterium]
MGAALVATAAVLAGCGVTGGSEGTESVSAVFADVGGLVSGAPVQMADIQIGNVTSIALDGTRARV